MEIYNPRKKEYKMPFGAVPSETNVQCTVYPHRFEAVVGGQLIANFEGDREVRVELEFSGLKGAHDAYTAQFSTGDFVGLVWYHFRLRKSNGDLIYVRPDHDPIHGVYQLTVYENEEVASWFGEGMSYQIFPDRFNRTKIPNAEGMVGTRTVHENWNDPPAYLPNNKGEVRNRDFFGGDLKGITEKLDYLSDLGVETVYLCPIFEAPENHRYGTADYDKIDPMLGTNEDFTTLCDEAHKRNMKIMLDGVFNHAGYVSRYFNGDGYYPDLGASQSKDSPYYDWFDFKEWPKVYDSWWGIYSLPSANEKSESYKNFIFGDKDSVVRKWLRAGADGWRLDVADELPDEFVAGIHKASREEKSHALVIGEVWEDGSTKEAYGVRRKHVLGGHCDGLMNYPFRMATLEFFNGGDSQYFIDSMETLRENYPKFAFYSAMNALGTHDTLRILTLLGYGGDAYNESKTWRFEYRLTKTQLKTAKMKLKASMALLFSFPGSPTVYYGDEAGMEGFEDPFNRYCYPWGNEDLVLVDWIRQLGHLRKKSNALRVGDIRYLETRGEVLAYLRKEGEEEILCIFNNFEHSQRVVLPELQGKTIENLLRSDSQLRLEDGVLVLPPYFGGLFQVTSSK